jgi:hypothetical protein
MTGKGCAQTSINATGQRTHTNMRANKTLQTTRQQGGMRKQGSTQQGGGRNKHAGEQNTTSNKTGLGSAWIKTGWEKTNTNSTPRAMQKGDGLTAQNKTIKKSTASGQTQMLNATKLFHLWEVVLMPAGILVCLWEVVLAGWLSPVIWELGKKKSCLV